MANAKQNFSQKTRQTVLITGASAGIGRDYARYLAALNYDLVLTARRADRLNALADELRASFSCKVTVLPADLADPKTPSKLAAEIEKRRLQIDYLVNNAGYATPGLFADNNWQAHRDMIQVMVTGVVELCHIFAPQMAARGQGRIVNVASVAAFLPGSKGDALYAPTKAFVLRFSQSLTQEYRGRGVNIVALCPGFTWSEFHDVAGYRPLMKNLPNFVWLEGPRVVRDAHLAVDDGNGPVVVNGFLYKFVVMILKWLPENLTTYLLGRGHQRRTVKPVPPEPISKPVKESVTPKASTKKPTTKKASAKKPNVKKSDMKKPVARKPTRKPVARKIP